MRMLNEKELLVEKNSQGKQVTGMQVGGQVLKYSFLRVGVCAAKKSDSRQILGISFCFTAFPQPGGLQ